MALLHLFLPLKERKSSVKSVGGERKKELFTLMWNTDTLRGIYLYSLGSHLSLTGISSAALGIWSDASQLVSCCSVKTLFLWWKKPADFFFLTFSSLDLTHWERNGILLNIKINFRSALGCILNSHPFLEHRDRLIIKWNEIRKKKFF